MRLLVPMLLAARPLMTDDPWSVEDRIFELETGQDLLDGNGGYVQWKYGFGNRWELDMGVPWHLGDTADIGDLEFAAKWSFIQAEDKRVPDLALVTSWAPGTNEYALCAITGKEIGPGEILANLVYESASPRLSWGLGGAVYPTEKAGLVAEVFGQENPILGAGLRITPWEFLMLDAGYHRVLDDSGSQVATLGLTLDF